MKNSETTRKVEHIRHLIKSAKDAGIEVIIKVPKLLN
jgi:pullulanase/glycogen debranching enzyme